MSRIPVPSNLYKCFFNANVNLYKCLYRYECDQNLGHINQKCNKCGLYCTVYTHIIHLCIHMTIDDYKPY